MFKQSLNLFSFPRKYNDPKEFGIINPLPSGSVRVFVSDQLLLVTESTSYRKLYPLVTRPVY
jgi:hypothetical protein